MAEPCRGRARVELSCRILNTDERVCKRIGKERIVEAPSVVQVKISESNFVYPVRREDVCIAYRQCAIAIAASEREWRREAVWVGKGIKAREVGVEECAAQRVVVAELAVEPDRGLMLSEK